MKPRILITCIWLILAGCFTACTDDSTIAVPVDPGEQETPAGTVNVNLSIPSARMITTYGMEEIEECEIESIDVLVFNNVGSDQHKFLYHETGVDIREVTSEPTKRRFSMKIRQTSNPNNVYLMVLANVSGLVEELIEAGDIAEGDNQQEVLKKLVFKLPYDETTANEGGKWLVKPGRYTRFPMWGISDPVDLTQTTISVAPVSLLRAPAKIDIGLAFNDSDVAQGLDNFFLEEFYLYNAYSSLMVAPDVQNNYDAVAKKVTKETLPPGVTTFEPNKPIVYKRRDYRGEQGYKDFINEIYLAEHEKGSQEEREKNVAVVIGGRYGSKTAAITYYRIDLVKHDNGVSFTEWLPVLRNHRYRINITRVLNRGYDTKEEAFAAMGLNTNLEVDIVDQDENITENVYDGQYRLGVDKTKFTIDKNGITSTARPKQIYVSTNYEAGWKATANVSWITFIQDDGVTTGATKLGPTGISHLKFLVEPNETNRARTGVITILAGRLYIEITVTQTASADIETTVPLKLYPLDGTNQSFTVKSTFDWAVRITDDTYNVISSFTKSGTASPTTFRAYNFTGINELLMDALPDDQKNQTVTFEFYSPTDEFEPFQQKINVGCYHEFEDVITTSFGRAPLVVYVKDQPTTLTWYVSANVANINNTTVPGPGSSGQINPALTNSCASLTLLGGKWRLPTQADANLLNNSNNITKTTYTQYGMQNNGYYWLATTVSGTNANAHVWTVSNGNTTGGLGKHTPNYGRCVRTGTAR